MARGRFRQPLRLVQRFLHLSPHDLVRLELLLLVRDAVVVHQEFALQNSESVQLVEKVRGGAHGIGNRVPGMSGDVRVQQSVAAREIEVIHPVECAFDGGRLSLPEQGAAEGDG